MKIINQSHINKAINYDEYKNIVTNLVQRGKTSGDDQSPEMIEYSKMNYHRMNRLEKTTILNDNLIEAFKKISIKYYLVVLTEAWCGDAAQILPIFDKLSQINPNTELKILFRDENLEIIDDNLTNGTRSIPKLIVIDEDFNKITSWGPRPQVLNQLVAQMKKKPDFNKEEMIKEIQIWYNQDNTQELQKEFIELAELLS